MSAAEYQTNLREIIVPLLDCLIEKKRDIKSRTGIDVPTINNFIQNTKILHLDDLKLLAEYFFINRVTYLSFYQKKILVRIARVKEQIFCSI